MMTKRFTPVRYRLGMILMAVGGALVGGGSALQAQAGPDTAPDTASAAAAPTTVGIETAIAMALSSNPELEAARYTVVEAQEQVSEAWGNVFPVIDFTSSYTRNFTPPVSFLPGTLVDPDADPDELLPFAFGGDNIWNMSIDVEQPLFNAAAFIGVGAAGRFEALQDEALRGRAQTVVTRVRETYYRLLLAQEQVRLLENSIRRVEESLAETRALADAGLVSEYDVLRLEVELANLTPNLRRGRDAVAQDRRALAVELGMAGTPDLRVAGSLATMRLDDLDANSPENREILALGGADAAEPDTVLSRAMSMRSDLLQLELTESLRNTELRLEQVQYLPRVTLFGTYGLTSQQNDPVRFFGDPQGYSRLAGVRVSLPIFQGLQRDARIDQRRAVLERSRLETEYARSQARNEIRTLLAAAEEARARAEGQALAVEQATRGYDIASAQYREGIGTQLELTDAEVALRQSEFNYAQAVHDYLLARARLDRATGAVVVDRSTENGGEAP